MNLWLMKKTLISEVKVMDEYGNTYSLDIMNRTLAIKGVLLASLYREDKYKGISEGCPLSMIYNRLLKVVVDGKPIFDTEKSCIEWCESENSYILNLFLLDPFPDFNMEEKIKKEINNKFMAFYTYGDCKILHMAGLHDDDIYFLEHRPQAMNFLYTALFLGNSIVIKL